VARFEGPCCPDADPGAGRGAGSANGAVRGSSARPAITRESGSPIDGGPGTSPGVEGRAPARWGAPGPGGGFFSCPAPDLFSSPALDLSSSQALDLASSPAPGRAGPAPPDVVWFTTRSPPPRYQVQV